MVATNRIVMCPSPFIGHIVSMVELAKLTLKHHSSLSIIFLVINPPALPQVAATPTSIASYIDHISLAIPSISFQLLPATKLPPFTSFEAFAFELIRLNIANLQQAFLDIISSRPLSSMKAVVLDFFCNPAFEVAQSLHIPTYYFWTTCASGLPLLLNLPTLQETMLAVDHRSLLDFLKSRNGSIDVPGMPSIPWCDAPPPLTVGSSKEVYDHFISTSVNMSKSRGIIINTFEALESTAIELITKIVPVYSIGPLVVTDHDEQVSLRDENECLAWLNLQPSKSVVFLCFGSLGTFSEEQLREIAQGLEKSGHRFLWVVRKPPNKDSLSLHELLPKGFLHRTKDVGFVIESWAPQVDVLNHGSVGGFVTHCGWNSVLEAIRAGVPMVGWPLYAEQRLNRVFLVNEMKVALPLDNTESGLVEGTELSKQIKELMDVKSTIGGRVRKEVMAMQGRALDALCETGSSQVALAKLAKSWGE